MTAGCVLKSQELKVKVVMFKLRTAGSVSIEETCNPDLRCTDDVSSCSKYHCKFEKKDQVRSSQGRKIFI